MLARSKSVANPEFQPTFNFLLDCGLYEPFAVYAHVKQKKTFRTQDPGHEYSIEQWRNQC